MRTTDRNGALHRIAVTAFALAACVPGHAAGDAEQFAQGKKLFTQGTTPACALCHTLKDAGSEGAVGPILDELKPDAVRVANALRNGLGNMPAYKATPTWSKRRRSPTSRWLGKALCCGGDGGYPQSPLLRARSFTA